MSALAIEVYEATPVARPIAGWMVMTIDSLRLTLPQSDVRLIELLVDLSPSPADGVQAGARAAQARSGQGNDAGGMQAAAGGREIGWLARRNEESWPVYCLDRGLRLQSVAPPSRRMCVFIEAHGAVAGIACDRVVLLATDAELSVQPVPGCMTGVSTPITGFARHQKGITAVATATALTGYLAHLLEHGHGAHQ